MLISYFFCVIARISTINNVNNNNNKNNNNNDSNNNNNTICIDYPNNIFHCSLNLMVSVIGHYLR